MESKLAALKARARKALHGAFSYEARYKDDTLNAAVPVKARWHNRIVLLGDYQDGGYANIIDGIERVIFDRDELAKAGITPIETGTVTILDHNLDVMAVLTLDSREPYVGPVEEKWQVKRDDR